MRWVESTGTLFPRHIFWMREAWLEVALAEMMGLSFMNAHSFKVGLFLLNLDEELLLAMHILLVQNLSVSIAKYMLISMHPVLYSMALF